MKTNAKVEAAALEIKRLDEILEEKFDYLEQAELYHYAEKYLESLWAEYDAVLKEYNHAYALWENEIFDANGGKP